MMLEIYGNAIGIFDESKATLFPNLRDFATRFNVAHPRSAYRLFEHLIIQHTFSWRNSIIEDH